MDRYCICNASTRGLFWLLIIIHVKVDWLMKAKHFLKETLMFFLNYHVSWDTLYKEGYLFVIPKISYNFTDFFGELNKKLILENLMGNWIKDIVSNFTDFLGKLIKRLIFKKFLKISPDLFSRNSWQFVRIISPDVPEKFSGDLITNFTEFLSSLFFPIILP